MKLPRNFNTIGPPPYPYQMETIIFGIRNKCCGLLLDMGLGKTRCAIDIARFRIQNEDVKKVLVITPTSILHNWKKEVYKFSEYKAIVLHSQNRQTRLYYIDQFKDSEYKFGIINYEALAPFIHNLLSIDIGMLIFDESARYIKNPSALRTKASITISDKVKSNLILTGTPIANKPLDIWSQFRIMDGGETFGKSFYTFRRYYFYKIKFKKFTKYTLRKKSYKPITDGIYNTCIVFNKQDVLPDLPAKIYHKIILPLSDSISIIYNKLVDQIVSQIAVDDGVARITIASIFTQLLRLQTITSGFIKDDDGDIRSLKYNPKLTALTEEIESIVDADESVVVWVKFLHSITMIEKRLKLLGISCITMSGQDDDKYSKWNTYQKDESVKVFIGQIESGGIGIELFKLDSNSETQHMIFYENVFSLDTRQQAEDRIHRIGQRSICRYVDIIIENTVDEKILNSFMNKKKIADSIMKDGLKQWLLF